MGWPSLFRKPKEKKEELRVNMARRINKPTSNYHREILNTSPKSRMAKMYEKEWMKIKSSQKDQHMLMYFIPSEDIKKLSKEAEVDESDIRNKLLSPQTISNLKKVLGDRSISIEGVGDLGLLLAVEVRPNERTNDIVKMIKKSDIDSMVKLKLKDVLKRPITENDAKMIIERTETRRPLVASKMIEATELAARGRIPKKMTTPGKHKYVWFISRVRKPV